MVKVVVYPSGSWANWIVAASSGVITDPTWAALLRTSVRHAALLKPGEVTEVGCVQDFRPVALSGLLWVLLPGPRLSRGPVR